MAERKRYGDQPEHDARDDYDAPASDEDAASGDEAYEANLGDDATRVAGAGSEGDPDVFLDVPNLKVDEIHLEVDDLNAQVSLQASVLQLLKLHVGAELSLGRVVLDIKGVDAKVPMGRKPARPANADIAFTAKIRAKRLRFGEVPRTRTEFTGNPGHESGSGSDRANLPERVKKDVTYRNVRVDYRLASALRYWGEAGDAAPED